MKILTYEARRAKGLTLVQLSEKTKISKSTLQCIETGQVSPTLKQLEAIALALDTKITALFMSPNK